MISIASNNPTRFRIDANSYLTYNGSEVVFYAAKNTDDPNNYSLHAYQALYYGTDGKFAPNGSIPFKVYAELAGYPNASTTSSVAPTTSTKPSTATTLYPNATSSGKNASATAPPPPHSTGAASANSVVSFLVIGAAVFAIMF